MKIVSLELTEYAIPFTCPVTTAWGVLARRRGIVVTVMSTDGVCGFGEIAPLPGFSRETLIEAGDAAYELGGHIVGATIPDGYRDLTSWLAQLAKGRQCPPSTVCGLETALADLLARRSNQSLARWIGLDVPPEVPVNAVLAGDADVVVEQISVLHGSGFRTFKLKVGAASPEDDRRTIERVLAHLPADTSLRLDANGAWKYEQAKTALQGVPHDRIEFIEEPLARSEIYWLSDLHARTGIGFALDESVLNPQRWRTLLHNDAVVAVMLKPTLIGGPSAFGELGRRAAAAGKKVLVSSTFESGIGVATCLQLAAGVGCGPCGLDTLRYLETSLLLEVLDVFDGVMRVPEAPGLGVTFDRAHPWVERIALVGKR